MLKARPDVWDIGSAIEQRLELDWWRLAHSYRADLVAPGQPCVLWITRGDTRVPSGIWAHGRILSEAVPGPGDPDDGLWCDKVAQLQIRPRVEVELTVLAQPLRREELAADPRLRRMEILRVPRIGNPAALTPSEWQVVRELLPPEAGSGIDRLADGLGQRVPAQRGALDPDGELDDPA